MSGTCRIHYNIAPWRAVPVVAEAATMLKVDADLVSTLRFAVTQIPELPSPRASGPVGTVSLPQAFDGHHLWESYAPAAPIHNVEKAALEASGAVCSDRTTMGHARFPMQSAPS